MAQGGRAALSRKNDQSDGEAESASGSRRGGPLAAPLVRTTRSSCAPPANLAELQQLAPRVVSALLRAVPCSRLLPREAPSGLLSPSYLYSFPALT